MASKRTSGKAATGSKRSSAARSSPKSRGSGKRELIAPNGDKRYVRRDGEGQFKESDDVGKSLAADRRQHAKTKAKRGEGDRGDH